MKQKIYLALTHDWELRGNGSGDIEQIQFEPLRKLLDIYGNANVRTTILPDLMQQLTFTKLEREHPALQLLADRWDEHVQKAFKLGHDVQLHLHPQWLNATYVEGRWQLRSDWSLLNYDPATAREMILAGKNYLEKLIQPLDSNYRCIAFRAGALAIGPSPHLLSLLVELGIELDVSIAGGLYIDTKNLTVDFRNCEEDVEPFYPRLDDARKVSAKSEKIICVPIHHFHGSRRQALAEQYSMVRRKLSSTKTDHAYSLNEWGQKGRTSLVTRLYDKGIAPYLSGKYLLADTARLNDIGLKEMLRSIRRGVANLATKEVPVVVTNHPKEITDFGPIERFITEVARADDIECITLTELSKGIQSGQFHVKTKAAD
jgi:hypothetical protein